MFGPSERYRVECILSGRCAEVDEPEPRLADHVAIAERLRVLAWWDERLPTPGDLADAVELVLEPAGAWLTVPAVVVGQTGFFRANGVVRDEGLALLLGVAKFELSSRAHEVADVWLVVAELAAPASVLRGTGLARLLVEQRRVPAWFLQLCLDRLAA